MKIFLLGFIALLFATTPSFALTADVIGHVQTLKGSAFLLRDNLRQPAVIGGPVYRGDVIQTSQNSSLGIALADDTTFSMGPNSELAIKNYVFDPKEARFALLARMVKGTFVYVSGLMAKLAPNSIKLEIPDATIAVRGTKLLVEIQE